MNVLKIFDFNLINLYKKLNLNNYIYTKPSKERNKKKII